MSGIEELKILNKKLKKLLDHPELGLITWRETLSECLIDMAMYAGHGNIRDMLNIQEIRAKE